MASLRSRRSHRGLLVAFEGGEGVGKTTQMRRLAATLRREGYSVILTRQPGATVLGRYLRRAVLDPRHRKVSPRAELLLYEADRAQHVDELIVPALADGKIVLTDRYSDSSTIYQGLCRELGVPWVEQLNAFATNDLSPDLVLLLDVPVPIAFSRVHRRGRGKDKLEREKRSFHEKVRRGFLSLARRDAKRFEVIDGTEAPEEVAKAISGAVLARLARRKK